MPATTATNHGAAGRKRGADGLTSRQRRAAYLLSLGMQQTEIAVTMGVSKQAVHKLLKKAKVI